MQFGFKVVARGDDVEFHVFGEARANRPALVNLATDSDCRAVLMGRLYYRGELLARLRDAGCVQEPTDDAELALAAYRRFGQAGIERLEGDFSLVLWDRKERRLLASREAMGGYPIFWLQQGETIAFATGLRPLMNHLPSHSVNVEFLGEVLMLPNVEIDYFEGTVFERIHRLVPGWSITADLARGAVSKHEFWKWPERIADPGTASTDEMAARFGALLRQAVRERLRGCTAAHLSGGMDSTSVALLAGEELAQSGQTVHALSLVYQNLSNLDAETPYLEEALNRPGIVPHRIAADDIQDYDMFRDMPLHDEPISGLYRYGLQAALLRRATEVGADTVFTGLGADEALAIQPYYIADLLRRGRLWSAWSAASRWARAQNVNVWWGLRRFGLSPLLPAWSHAGFSALCRGGYADWLHQNFMTIAPWVLPDFARSGQLRRRVLNHHRQMFQSTKGVARSEALAQTRYFCGDGVRYTLAAPLGIVSAHPFRDLRVFSYGLGIRAKVRPVPGVQKPILAAAMRDVLPANIRERRGKTHFNSVYYAGLSRNRSFLEDLIQKSPVEELGLFDKDCLRRCLQQAALCICSPHGAVSLDNSLSIVMWLAQLPEWLAKKNQPTRVVRSGRQETGPHQELVEA